MISASTPREANFAVTASRAATAELSQTPGQVDDHFGHCLGVVERVREFVGGGEEQLAGDRADADAAVRVEDAGDADEVGDAAREIA